MAAKFCLTTFRTHCVHSQKHPPIYIFCSVYGFRLSFQSMFNFMDILFQFPDWLWRKSADQGEFRSGNSQIEQWINPPYSAVLRHKYPLFLNIVWFIDFDLKEILVQFLDWLSRKSADRRGFFSGNLFPIPPTLFLFINPQTALRAYHVSGKPSPLSNLCRFMDLNFKEIPIQSLH